MQTSSRARSQQVDHIQVWTEMNQDLQLRHERLNCTAAGCTQTDRETDRHESDWLDVRMQLLFSIQHVSEWRDRWAGRQVRTFDHLDGHFGCRMRMKQTGDGCFNDTTKCTRTQHLTWRQTGRETDRLRTFQCFHYRQPDRVRYD